MNLIRIICLLLLNPAGIGACYGGTWYVDQAAAGGLNDGKSWTNAWTNFQSLDWPRIRPGDVIEIAKGDYTNQGISFGSSGTPNAPITIRLARDAGHRGIVQLAGISYRTQNWVTVDGALDDAFAPPAAVSDLEQITNNIGFYIHSSDRGVWARGANDGIRLLWLKIYKCGTFGQREQDGIRLNGPQHHSEIGYCWLLDNVYGDGICYVRSDEADWGGLAIHDCLIDNIGDDALNIAGGTDVYRCIIQHRTYGLCPGAHTDCFQTWGARYRIHHNIIRNFACTPDGSTYNSLSYAQFSTELSGDFLFYNNLVYDDDKDRLGAPGLELIFDAWWAPNKHNTHVVITNIFIANNLFCKPAAQAIRFTLHGRSDPSRGTNDLYTITNCLVANNIFLDCYRTSSAELQGVAVGLLGQNANDPVVRTVPPDMPLLNNIMAGPNQRISYMGRVYENIAAAGKASGFPDNWAKSPSFVGYKYMVPPYDFRLDPNDTVARKKGCNLDSYANRVPMLNVNLDAQTRDKTAGWNIGPY